MRINFFHLLIFVLIIAVGVSYWVYQRQVFSKDILKLEILGPETCQAGEEIEYTIKYKNNGNVRLENLKFVFEFPESALLSPDQSQRITKELNDIYPGQEEIFKFQTRLFGKEGDIKTAKVNLTYQPKNLKAIYQSQSTFSTKIESVPLTFTFDFPSKVVTAKEVEISINYFSNLDFPLSDLRIKAEYPSDFEFLKSKPEGIGKNEWEIKMLNKAEGGRIDIAGVVDGEIGSRKVFKAELGIWLQDKFFVLKETNRGLEIIKPHLAISQQINGAPDYIASPGELLHYEIFFRNIGVEAFENLFLVSDLEGPFESDSINSDSGKINRADGSILWDWRDVSELRYLGPGEEGKVEFWVSLKKDWPVRSPADKNFVLKNAVLLSQIRDETETKINSQLVIEQKGYFEDEVFGNSGPIPPQVGRETSYTIIWQIKNYYNDVDNVRVRAVLPLNVSLTGNIFPEEEKEKFTFDSSSREIVWQVGNLNAGIGILSPHKSLAFQIKLTPSENQRGLVATLINEVQATGEDQFTGMKIKASDSLVDTTLPDDSTASSDKGVIQ